jgi:hypothetical protein
MPGSGSRCAVADRHKAGRLIAPGGPAPAARVRNAGRGIIAPLAVGGQGVWIVSPNGTAQHAGAAPGEPRYTIRRRDGQTWCSACDATQDFTGDPPGYALWLTVAAARQRGLTHCDQCGRSIVPIEPAPSDCGSR